MALLLGCALAYLLGAIPFALLLVRVLKGVDVRTLGSGNVGATNASRAFGSRARIPMFLAVYVLDFGKGFLPTWYGPELFSGPEFRAVLFGACAVLGHCSSPFLGFKGGKGVATTTGVVAAIDPLALGVGLLTFFAVLGLTRQVFLGSLGLGLALAATVILREPSTAFGERLSSSLFVLAIAAFLFYTHRSNIQKLLAQRGKRDS